MPTTPKPDGALDPGAPPRRKSRFLTCTCCCATLAFVGLVTTLLLVGGIGLTYSSILRFLGNVSNPHRGVFQDVSLGGVADRSLVVQPLVTRDQTFDIAVTVWLRSTKVGHREVANGTVSEKSRDLEVPPSGADRSGGQGDGDLNREPVPIEDGVVPETVLYSDIIFREVRLADKDVYTTVNFTLPTAIFLNANLSNYDLRGSFILIPSAPSLLNHLVNYSSWIPDTVKPFPVRAWPFPLGSPDFRERTLAEEAVESFSVTVPLLQFRSIYSKCGNTTNSGEVSDVDGPLDVSNTTRHADTAFDGLEITDGMPASESHPHIVTSTQLRVVDETRVFNLKAYGRVHKQLKAKACGRGEPDNVRPNRYKCKRSYRNNGHWETQLQLRILNESGEEQTEWAYPPYMSASRHAGQKNLLAVPINRENCSVSNGTTELNPTPDQDFVDVAWRISYLGRTPKKFLLLELADIPMVKDSLKRNISEPIYQDMAELASGVAGHKFDEHAQPRRVAFLVGLRIILTPVDGLLDFRYWFTRSSTVSITIFGTALVATYDISTLLIVAAFNLVSFGVRIRGVLFMLFHFIVSVATPLLMIKAVMRIEFGWRGGQSWIPVARRAGATHQERASERLEARMSWWHRIGLLVSLVVVYYTLTPRDIHIISPAGPPPAPFDALKSSWLRGYLFFSSPVHITGKILQIILNWRSRSYAGGYKISAVLVLVSWAAKLCSFVPAFIWRLDSTAGLSVHEATDGILDLVIGWQALTLPSVSQTPDDDHYE